MKKAKKQVTDVSISKGLKENKQVKKRSVSRSWMEYKES
jgi:hypothetical protein